MSALLELRDLSVDFVTPAARVSAVSQVSLQISEGEVFGLVGETGCGKTTLATAIMGLLPPTAALRGAIRFQQRELVGISSEEYRKLRGDRISMVFQDPMSSLDPAFPIGEQVAETIRAHRPVDKKAARARALALLKDVGIPEPERRYDDPPHRLSGGMRQRVVIAIALANEPALLLADEPTTALDVTIQAQVLELLRDLQRRHRTTILLITHDLGVIAQICDRVGVMYAGQLVEVASVEDVFLAARHPYTRALLEALPSAAHAHGQLPVIPGQVPDLSNPPSGCRFAPRCPHRMAECAIVPKLADEMPGHAVACWLTETTRRAGSETAVRDAPEAGNGVPVAERGSTSMNAESPG